MPQRNSPITDILVCLSLLTRLPVRLSDDAYRRQSQSAWAFPIVGAIWGGIVGGIIVLALIIGMGPSIAALIGLCIGILITGAMHEDGLADCADGFWGAWDRARRLEIMKDSQIGTYGVMALIVTFALRWQAITGLIAQGNFLFPIIIAATLSRSLLPYIMARIPNARGSGLSHSVGMQDTRAALIAMAIAIGVAVFLMRLDAIWVLGMAIVAGLAVTAIARTKIGGQTGDTLGATQQIVETTVLLTCLAL